MTFREAELVVESLIFAAQEPISASEIAKILDFEPQTVEVLVEEIKTRYARGALLIREVAGGYQIVTRPELAPWLEKLGRSVVDSPLSMPATETLAIIAYQQPVTKAEIEQIRGVQSDGVVRNLLERELVCELGRKTGPGRPILYGVTPKFLLHFGLKSLEELPLKYISDGQ